MSRNLNNVAETKLKPLRGLNEAGPSPIQVGANAQVYQFALGATAVSSWTGTWHYADGIQMSQGSDNNDFTGRYVYFKKSHISVEIDMGRLAQFNDKPPIEFRFIMAKIRRANTPAGITPNPATTLFLDEAGAQFGSQTPGKDGSDLMLQPLNKRDYSIYCDKKFILSSPRGPDNSTGYTGHYPCFKRFYLDCPMYKKTRMSEIQNNVFVPEDLGYRYFVVIYARSLDKDTPADNWELNMRGTTSYSDM